MPHLTYLKPPITEAVIDFQFAQPISQKLLDKASKPIVKRFPKLEKSLSLGIELGQSQIQVAQSPQGYKASSEDSLDIVLLQPNNLTNSRLSPYNGWEEFQKRSEDTWSIFCKCVGKQRVRRLGVRYINRLDIPDDKVILNEWINLGIKLPDNTTEILNEFAIRAGGIMTNGEKFTINCNMLNRH